MANKVFRGTGHHRQSVHGTNVLRVLANKHTQAVDGRQPFTRRTVFHRKTLTHVLHGVINLTAQCLSFSVFHTDHTAVLAALLTIAN